MIDTRLGPSAGTDPVEPAPVHEGRHGLPEEHVAAVALPKSWVPLGRHHGLPPASPIGQVFKFLSVAMVVVIVSIGSLGAILVWQTLSKAQPTIQLASPPLGSLSAGGSSQGINILLVGTHPPTAQNLADGITEIGNDVTILLHVSGDHTQAHLVNFSRDMQIDTPDCASSEAGSATTVAFSQTMTMGGLPCTVLTVEAMTGLPIPYALEINFDAAIALSSAVGGVTVNLPEPINDSLTGVQLPAGRNTLIGAGALNFVLSREQGGDGTTPGVVSNQQRFIDALVRQIMSAQVLTNPVALYSLANVAVQNVQFSESLANPLALASVAGALRNVDVNSMTFVPFPVTTDPSDPTRKLPDEGGAEQLSTSLRV